MMLDSQSDNRADESVEDRRAVYEQDMESIRYRHAAKWSRFQTVSAIEGAALWVSFRGELSRTESILIIILATMLISVIFVLVVTDDRFMAAYGKRVDEFEKSTGVSPPSGNPIKVINPTMTLIVGVLIFNAAVAMRLIVWPEGL